MWTGIVQDWALGIPAIFAPEKTLKLTRQRKTGDPTWTAFAALMVTLVSFLYIPGTENPRRYRAAAIGSVLARPPGVVFFLLLRKGTYPMFGIIDALLSLTQIPLLMLTFREHRRDGDPGQDGAPSAASGRKKDIEREALFVYDGSTFDEVKQASWAGPYDGKLPRHRGAGPTTFMRLVNDGARNLIDRRDVLPHFDKLIHSNGITMTGVWRIDADSPYTGYFANGSEGLVLARGSVAANALKSGQRRAFGWGVKVWPTMDPTEKAQPGNIVTVSKLSGERKRHIVDYAPTNNPPIGFDPAARLVNQVLFRLMDTRPGWRQVYPVSALGLPDDAEVRTPDLFMLRVADGTPRVDEKDFRDELRLEHYPGHRLVYDICVKDFADEEYRRIGAIEFDDYAIAEGGDKRLHFWIPRDVPSVPSG
jgi:hypothetical protein